MAGYESSKVAISRKNIELWQVIDPQKLPQLVIFDFLHWCPWKNSQGFINTLKSILNSFFRVMGLALKPVRAVQVIGRRWSV
ncbi:MAG: hypothetical protein IJ775_02760, partial [Muribaculaceae bacterium]|nr:hypothetical protein [Muribaculaceae bacterium]